MAVSICMVPLEASTDPAAAEIAKHLAQAWPGLPEIENLSDGECTASFTLGLATVIVAEMSTGIPWSDLEGPCSAAVLWPDAVRALHAHPAHLIVTVSADLDETALPQ